MIDSSTSPLPPAGLGRRFAGYLLDTVIVSAVQVLFVIPLDAAGYYSPEEFQPAMIVLLLPALAGLAYYIWGWSGNRTVGMRVTAIQIVDEFTTQPIGAGRAFGRYLMVTVMALPCYLGFLSILTDTSGYNRGWNDRAVRSRVVLWEQAGGQPDLR